MKNNYWTNFMSVVGAGILGFGLGAYFAEIFKPYAAWIIIAGIILHGGAMLANNNKMR